jgi:hypothetical protein
MWLLWLNCGFDLYFVRSGCDDGSILMDDCFIICTIIFGFLVFPNLVGSAGFTALLPLLLE